MNRRLCNAVGLAVILCTLAAGCAPNQPLPRQYQDAIEAFRRQPTQHPVFEATILEPRISRNRVQLTVGLKAKRRARINPDEARFCCHSGVFLRSGDRLYWHTDLGDPPAIQLVRPTRAGLITLEVGESTYLLIELDSRPGYRDWQLMLPGYEAEPDLRKGSYRLMVWMDLSYTFKEDVRSDSELKTASWVVEYPKDLIIRQ